MAFDDEDFEKAKATGTSNTQLYKQAGNSIVVNCNYYIFKELFRAFPDVFEDMRVVSLFSGIGAFEKALERLYKELNEEWWFISRSFDVVMVDDYELNINSKTYHKDDIVTIKDENVNSDFYHIWIGNHLDIIPKIMCRKVKG